MGAENRYLPLALIVVAIVFALAITNWRVWFALLDPPGAIERATQREYAALGGREAPLSSDEAFALLDEYARHSSAGNALVHQDQRYGLPEDFVAHLEARFNESGGADHLTRSLLTRMASHRPLSASVETTFAALARQSNGFGPEADVLGDIGTHRPLSSETLEVLLAIADQNQSGARTALSALAQVAQHQGLPVWALDRLEDIAGRRRGIVRSDAIKAIAAAGDKSRAMALMNEDSPYRPYPDAVATALAGDDLASLVQTLKNDTLAMELRVGALELIVKRRDQSETVGAALSYALSSDGPLLYAAYDTYTSYGRHHARHIDADWRRLSAAHFDSDAPLRFKVADAFRFVPFASRAEREAFLLEMLAGSPRQQQTALLAVRHEHPPSDALLAGIAGLQASPHAEVAQLAAARSAQYVPESKREKLADWLAGTAFWICLALPIVAAIGWQTWFVARLMRSLVARSRRLPNVLACLIWFVGCVALGLLLFTGLLGFGHSGRLEFAVYAVLLVLGAGVLGVGALLNLLTRTRPAS